MRLAERLRPRKQTLRPALPSRFEPTKTGAARETFRREADESFAVADHKGANNGSAARLIPYRRCPTDISVDDPLDQRKYEGWQREWQRKHREQFETLRNCWSKGSN